MKKIFLMVIMFLSLFTLFSCGNEQESSSEVESMSTLNPKDDFNNLWSEKYQDASLSFNENSVKESKLFYEGEYVSSDKTINKRKDFKREFYTNDKMRFVNSPEKYAITIPATNVDVDYSIGKYRVCFDFLDTTLTVTHETSNPYGGNYNGWYTYLNEWVNRYIDNPRYLADNNLEYISRYSNISCIF